MGMNRGEAIRRARRALNDTKAAVSQFWTPQDLNDSADDANLQVYQTLVRTNTHLVCKPAVAYTVPGGRRSFTFLESIGEQPYQIVKITPTVNAGFVSLTNPIGCRAIACDADALDAHRSQRVSAFYYCVMADSVEIAPINSISWYLTIQWVPQLAKMATDNDALLGGYAPAFQDEVQYTLAHLLNNRQNGFNEAVEREYELSQRRLETRASVITQGPMVVRSTRRGQFM